MSINPAQCRGARGLLGWSQSDLSKASKTATKTIADFERGAREPYPRTLEDVRAALEQAGVDELALAADRSYMLNDSGRPTAIHLSSMNAGALPMSNGLSRLASRFYGEPSRVPEVLAHDGPFGPEEALEAAGVAG